MTAPAAPAQLAAFVDREASRRASDLADIDDTIALWERTGVDYRDAWWAMDMKEVCGGGWPQVRGYMCTVAERTAMRARFAGQNRPRRGRQPLQRAG